MGTPPHRPHVLIITEQYFRGGDDNAQALTMPEMMTHMMPHCLEIMLPNVEKEKQINFGLKLIATGAEHGRVRMSEEEREDFEVKVVEKLRG